MKNFNRIGIAAALLLIVTCFLPWTYHSDLDKTFSGFFSENNIYGKPGKPLVLFAITAIFLHSIPKLWAKRVNIFMGVLTVAYCLKTYVLFTTCYRGICPERKPGIFLMLIASVVMVVTAVLPEMKIGENKSED
jgi:hypothetical protein